MRTSQDAADPNIIFDFTIQSNSCSWATTWTPTPWSRGTSATSLACATSMDTRWMTRRSLDMYCAACCASSWNPRLRLDPRTASRCRSRSTPRRKWRSWLIAGMKVSAVVKRSKSGMWCGKWTTFLGIATGGVFANAFCKMLLETFGPLSTTSEQPLGLYFDFYIPYYIHISNRILQGLPRCRYPWTPTRASECWGGGSADLSSAAGPRQLGGMWMASATPSCIDI